MKKILFITSTRADYGKLKSLINILQNNNSFQTFVCVTGMHNLKHFGSTWEKIKKYDKIKNVIRFSNQKIDDSMDKILSKTILNFSKITKKIKPDLIIIHGDRVETLASAIVGVLNNYLVCHIEGGEVSGTVDEILRHSISKLAHLHFVTNITAKKRLIQLGELSRNIFIIGSPDIDIMDSKILPTLNEVKYHYDINFQSYGIVLFHPVTTEVQNIVQHTKILIKSILKTKKNFVIIYPNNDLGSKYILNQYKKLKKNTHIKILPSMRFEYYLCLLKNANLIIGNSSSGIIEAPIYGVPTINIGSRQNRRLFARSIHNLDFNEERIKKKIFTFFNKKNRYKKNFKFGKGNSNKLFLKILQSKKIWQTQIQKNFKDL